MSRHGKDFFRFKDLTSWTAARSNERNSCRLERTPLSRIGVAQPNQRRRLTRSVSLLAKRIDDENAFDLSTVGHVFGVKLTAS